MLLSEYLNSFKGAEPVSLLLTPNDFVRGTTEYTIDKLRVTHRDWELSSRVVVIDSKGNNHIVKDRGQRPYHYSYRQIIRPNYLEYDL